MTTRRQQELFPERNWEAEYLAKIEARLPKGDFVRVPDLCAALDKSPSVVTAWIESGDICGCDLATGDGKRSFSILRDSVVAFYRRRLGLPSRGDIPVGH